MTEKLSGVESIIRDVDPEVRQCSTSQLLAEISQWFVTCNLLTMRLHQARDHSSHILPFEEGNSQRSCQIKHNGL